MPVHRKLSIAPVDVRVTAAPAALATLDEFRSFIGAAASDGPSTDAALQQHLDAASEFVQGPFSATRQCFTDHQLRADYPSHIYDLFLPGGRVKAATSVVVAVGRATIDRLVRLDQQWYVRMTASAEGAVTLTWTAGWARTPPLVKEATLRLATAYWAGEDNPTETEAAVREKLDRRAWV